MVVSLEQPVNAVMDIAKRLIGNSIDVNEEQPLKTPLSRVVTVDGSVIDANETHLAKR